MVLSSHGDLLMLLQLIRCTDPLLLFPSSMAARFVRAYQHEPHTMQC
jgi:hypothetical protein